MSVATPQQALANIRASIAAHTDIGVGECQLNAHEVYGIGGGYASAYLAWLGAKYKHTGPLKDAPLGAFVYWSGGHTMVNGQPAGHVAINAGNGIHVYTPGGPSDPNHWYLTTPDEIVKGWPGHVYVGWTEDINGTRVPGLEPKPKHKGSPNLTAAQDALNKAVRVNHGARKSAIQSLLDSLAKLIRK